MTYRHTLGISIVLVLSLSAWIRLEPLAYSQSKVGNGEEMARTAFKNGEHGKVIELLLDNNNVISKPSRLMLADSLHEKKRYEDEIRVLDSVLKENPDDFLVLTKIANAYLNANKSDEAILSFRAAIKKNPKYLPAYENLLFLFESSDNYYESRLVLKDMMRKFGNRSEYMHKLCRIDSLDGYLESSSKACLDAIFRDPSYPDSYIYLANNYRDTGEKVKALKAYTDAAKRFQQSEFVQSAAGRYFAEMKDFHAAYRYFSKAIKINPQSLRAHLGLAKSALEIKKYRTSLEAYIKACKMDRTVVVEFRHAASQLRVQQNYKWASDFEIKSSHCRLSDQK